MLLLIILLSGWCVLHSALIALPVKQWFDNKGGIYLGLYRLGYVVFSTGTLVPIWWYMTRQPQLLLFTYHGWWRLLQLLLLLYAAILFYGGGRIYDIRFFLGIRQWHYYRLGNKPMPAEFKTEGILRFVRHPWYSGAVAFIWALGPLTNLTLAGKGILTIYLLIGTLLEEHKLKKEIGAPYIAYCRRVPILIPWKFISGKAG